MLKSLAWCVCNCLAPAPHEFKLNPPFSFQLECSAALKRVEVGVPATVEFGSASDSKKNQQKHIMGATQVMLQWQGRVVQTDTQREAERGIECVCVGGRDKQRET